MTEPRWTKRANKFSGRRLNVTESHTLRDIETPSCVRRAEESLAGIFDDDETQPPSQLDTPTSTRSGTPSSNNPDDSSRATNSHGRDGKRKLVPDSLDWFDNPSIVSAVTASYQSYMIGPWTCLSSVPTEVQDRWWNNFRERYAWDPTDEQYVRVTYTATLKKRLRDNMSRESKKLAADPTYKCKYLTDEVAEQLRNGRLNPAFIEKSNKIKANRYGRDHQAAKSTQGSCATSHLAKKMAAQNNGVLPPPHEIFIKQHTRKDKSFVDDRARSMMDEFEARKAANPSISDVEAFYQAAGRHTKAGTVPGLGTASDMYYEAPRASKQSSSGYVPSQAMQWQSRFEESEKKLQATQDELLRLSRFLQEKLGYSAGTQIGEENIDPVDPHGSCAGSGRGQSGHRDDDPDMGGGASGRGLCA